MCSGLPLLLDSCDGVGPTQVKYTPPELSQDVCEVVIEKVHFGLLLGLFFDKIAILMHLNL